MNQDKINCTHCKKEIYYLSVGAIRISKYNPTLPAYKRKVIYMDFCNEKCYKDYLDEQVQPQSD